MGQRVKRFSSTVSEAQMAQAINEAWSELFGNHPTKDQVALIMAQNSLETGNRKSMWNNNIGNITTNGEGNFDFYDDLTTDEQVQPGVWKKKNLKYRSYRSLKDGAKDYLKLLKSPRYAQVWQHLKNPDPIAFSKALKGAGYYTANEEPYTKSIAKLYNQYSNKKQYSTENETDQKMAKTPSFWENILNKFKGKSMPTNDIDSLLNGYLQQVLASEKQNKKLYKQYLKNNDIIIRVASENYTDSLEFARVLCLALDEELLSKAFIHTDGKAVEVQSSIYGPESDCFKAADQLTQSIAEVFVDATKKIGGIQIKTRLITNKKSSYQPINLKTAEMQHRKFLLKFI
jgi:hypothetical protein